LLISQEYREQNRKLHELPNYGNSSGKWGKPVAELAELNQCRTILDYGCGKGDLKVALMNNPNVFEYDPAIEGKDSTPEPADMVVCTDVLEHIEPELIENVLDDLKRVTLKIGYFLINTAAAEKFLPDGRNAHVLQRPLEWWMPKLWERFEIQYMRRQGNDIVLVVTTK
jgi:hypothetical protein